MLDVHQLSVSYGKHMALDAVSLTVGRGEIVVMLGANGAGKSSCLKALGGVVRHGPGARIKLGGADISALEPHEVVEAGLALVPEDRGIFADLTVRENLRLGAFAPRAHAREAENLQRVLTLFPRLAERMDQFARTMSGGERQMVAIGRALMSNPDILLLDEPSLGLSPLVCKELFQALSRIKELGVGVLLVEQNARQGLAIASRGYLLENGRIVGDGAAAQLQDDPAVRRAYLGGDAHTGNGRAETPTPGRPLSNGRIASPVHATAASPGNGRLADAALAASSPEPAAAADSQPPMHTPSPGNQSMFDVSLMIGNADAKATGGATFDRLNPMTGEVATRAAAARRRGRQAAADAAAAAFPAWADMGPSARRALLNKAADLLDAAAAQFAAPSWGRDRRHRRVGRLQHACWPPA